MTGFDFDGDGRDDIFWYHLESTQVANWLGTANGSFIPNPDSNDLAPGRVLAVGDFNGDGRTDALWQFGWEVSQSLTGGGGSFYFQWFAGFVTNVTSDMQVAGVGDFNGDGQDDVLWLTGQTSLTSWLGRAGHGLLYHQISAATTIDPSWSVVGTGDFNGDGRDDLLLRTADGTVTDWLGQPNGTFRTNAAATYPVELAWSVAGTGDFNGDGRDDVLWRHANGTVTDWLGQADGTFRGNFDKAALPVELAWAIAATGDYNGDGRSDVLWRHTNGTVTNWLGQADGSFAGNYTQAAFYLEASWQILPNHIGAGWWD